ncbi:hypothetical protein [Actinacidiphila rubida]|uniref:hypothetical protein n=1 Tax=Actinacidiphila rubida TaxID=310780 RepID=UPI001FECB61D|nr:hypothetical protein [Actinacidiphila rubida]
MGPLPSSIYWRRRVVVLCLLALVAAVVAWAVNSSGGSGGKGSGAPAGSHTPVATITAGPAPTGTHISGRPGGRDTTSGGGTGTDGGTGSGSSDGGTGSGTAGDTSGSDAGTSGTDAAGGSSSGSSGSASTAGSSGGSAGSTGGGELPAGSSLPDCAPGAVQLGLATTQNSYGPGQTPQFKLTATNTSDITCKVDFGPTKAVFTVTQATGDSHVWASDDCPKTGAYLMQVPAHGSTAYTLNWDERTSSPKCASPKGQQAGLDTTYLVTARTAGYGSKQVSFRLSAD